MKYYYGQHFGAPGRFRIAALYKFCTYLYLYLYPSVVIFLLLPSLSFRIESAVSYRLLSVVVLSGNGRLRWNLLGSRVAAAADHRWMANRRTVCWILPASESIQRVHRGADAAHRPAGERTQASAHLCT